MRRPCAPGNRLPPSLAPSPRWPAATRFPPGPGSERSPSGAPSAFPDPRSGAGALQAARYGRLRQGQGAAGRLLGIAPQSASFAIALLRIMAAAGKPTGLTGLRGRVHCTARTHSDPESRGEGTRGVRTPGGGKTQTVPTQQPTALRLRGEGVQGQCAPDVSVPSGCQGWGGSSLKAKSKM